MVRFRAQDADSLTIPGWVPPVLFGVAVVLMPWTVWLLFSLPPHTVANHWAIAWGGFDIALGLSLAATGFLILRRSLLAEISATVSATMLACDAWFDVLTSRGRSDVAQAVAEAVLIELPLAILCLWIARNVERELEDVRPHLERAGFTVRDGRVVAPPEITAAENAVERARP